MKVLIRGNPGGKEITMAKVDWINGKIAPPESGEYYVILEATEAWDSVKAEERAVMAGEIEMTGDWYDTEEGCFQTIGKGNPFWRVLAWADILKPDVPEDIKPKLAVYFGQEVKWEDGKRNRRTDNG